MKIFYVKVAIVTERDSIMAGLLQKRKVMLEVSVRQGIMHHEFVIVGPTLNKESTR